MLIKYVYQQTALVSKQPDPGERNDHCADNRENFVEMTQ